METRAVNKWAREHTTKNGVPERKSEEKGAECNDSVNVDDDIDGL